MCVKDENLYYIYLDQRLDWLTNEIFRIDVGLIKIIKLNNFLKYK